MPAKYSRTRGLGPSPETQPHHTPHLHQPQLHHHTLNHHHATPHTLPPPHPPTAALPPRRSTRRQTAARAHPQPAANALILLTVGDIPIRDRHKLQCILDAFHANPACQAEWREILRNEAEYLVPDHTKDQGSGFIAKIETAAGKRLTLYAGQLSEFSGSPATHYMCMGDIGLGNPLIIDVIPRASGLRWADASAQARMPASSQRTFRKPGLQRHQHQRVLSGVCLYHPQRQGRPLLIPSGSNADLLLEAGKHSRAAPLRL